MRICIDSHTFVWSIKNQASDHDRHRLKEAERFLDWIRGGKHQIIIPTIVLAECLIGDDEDNHAAMLSEAARKFQVVDFDLRCSRKYGQILRLDKWQAAKDKLRLLTNPVREKMKIDHMILCCALVNNADAIMTEDPNFASFASPYIRIVSMPNIPQQAQIFESEQNDQLPF